MKKTFAGVALTVLLLVFAWTTTASATNDHAEGSAEGWYTWDVGIYNPDAENSLDVGWPQTLVGRGQVVPPCGKTYQQDRYEGTNEQIEAVTADGILRGDPHNDYYEDSEIVTDWLFVSGPVCPEPTVTPDPEPEEITAVGICEGDQWVVTTTTGGKTETTSTYDPTCVEAPTYVTTTPVPQDEPELSGNPGPLPTAPAAPAAPAAEPVVSKAHFTG